MGSDAQVDLFMQRFWLLILGVAAILAVPIIGLGVYLDWRLGAVDRDLSHVSPSQNTDQQVEVSDLHGEFVSGQTVYVSAYSHVYHQAGEAQRLTVTLSIRNTDQQDEILLTNIRYYDTTGQEIKSYLEKPLRLGPLASTDFVVQRNDVSGGSGANFIVEWVASESVSEPVIETVMIDTSGSQGISFVRPGKVLSDKAPARDGSHSSD